MNCVTNAGRWAVPAIAAILVATPAAALPGLSKHPSSSPTNSVSPKTAIAFCPEGKRVVGGGAWAFDGGAGQVVLTRLQPIHVPGARDRYMASAEEPAAGFTGNWWLQAYALCADPPDGYEIVAHSTGSSSPTFAETAAACPGGKRVTGTGAEIIDSGGQVGLQLSRSSGPRDISRSTARERANGYSGDWTLTSYAICANARNLAAEGRVTSSEGGDFQCPSSTPRVHAVGGGGSLSDTGASFLQVLYPFNDLQRVRVFMTGPLSQGMVIQAICGS